jgi:hypothetical protein
MVFYIIQGGSNMTGTNCDLFTNKSSRTYLNHLVFETGLNPSIMFAIWSSFGPQAALGQGVDICPK